MTIENASGVLSDLLSQTSRKSEKKIYNCFIRTLSSLGNKDLTENESQLIEEKLSLLNLNGATESRKKYYKQRLSEFKTFLKNEFSFTTEKHYTELGMVYGMIFGTGIGLSIGTAIAPVLGTSIGMSMGTGLGMVLGMVLGAQKDSEAKRLGLVF